MHNNKFSNALSACCDPVRKNKSSTGGCHFDFVAALTRHGRRESIAKQACKQQVPHKKPEPFRTPNIPGFEHKNRTVFIRSDKIPNSSALIALRQVR
jgi:hypothetical protein